MARQAPDPTPLLAFAAGSVLALAAGLATLAWTGEPSHELPASDLVVEPEGREPAV